MIHCTKTIRHLDFEYLFHPSNWIFWLAYCSQSEQVVAISKKLKT